MHLAMLGWLLSLKMMNGLDKRIHELADVCGRECPRGIKPTPETAIHTEGGFGKPHVEIRGDTGLALGCE